MMVHTSIAILNAMADTNDKPRYTKEVRDAKQEMMEAMRRYAFGSKNLAKVFLASIEKALPVFVGYQATAEDFARRSPIDEYKQRFQDIANSFESDIQDLSLTLTETLLEVKGNPDIRRIQEILTEMELEPASALDLVRGIDAETRGSNSLCRSLRQHTPEEFIEYLDTGFDEKDIRAAQAAFGDGHVPRVLPDSVPLNQTKLMPQWDWGEGGFDAAWDLDSWRRRRDQTARRRKSI